jgi:hypothetical protein
MHGHVKADSCNADDRKRENGGGMKEKIRKTNPPRPIHHWNTPVDAMQLIFQRHPYSTLIVYGVAAEHSKERKFR